MKFKNCFLAILVFAAVLFMGYARDGTAFNLADHENPVVQTALVPNVGAFTTNIATVTPYYLHIRDQDFTKEKLQSKQTYDYMFVPQIEHIPLSNESTFNQFTHKIRDAPEFRS